MLGTYAAALALIAISVPLGAAVQRAAGRRAWSPISPVLGLALASAIAWLAVRLPGEGTAALIALALAALLGGLWARTGLPRREAAAGPPATVALLALLAASLPFAAEGHFGILGTGFNVDMSQHLFVAEWISTQVAPAPDLVQQGYPVGPHALAVAMAELAGGNLVHGFSGVTIAVPALTAIAALAALAPLGRARAVAAAPLVALPYLVASYVAQGAFKEVFAAGFLLVFALWLHGLERGDLRRRGFALPGAVLVAGMIYAYSAPGLAWLIGTGGLLLVLLFLTEGARRRAFGRAVRTSLPGLAIGTIALVALIGPELSRVLEFGGSAGSVASAAAPAPAGPGGPAALHAQATAADAGPPRLPEPGGGGSGAEESLDLFDDSLGNLFGHIPALSVLGIWPSGDFRVEPGAGAVPAAVFYAGALLGALALAVGLARALRRRDLALLAALAASIAIWVAAWALSTPYTAAKALQMVAPLLILISLRGVLAPAPAGSGPQWLRPALAVALVAGAAASSALALANAPVGPERYSAGITLLRDRIAGEPVLMLAPPGQLADRHGAAYYGWELRGARPICVEAAPEQGAFRQSAPPGIRWVITVGARKAAPFDDLKEVSRRRRISLWEARSFGPDSPPVELDEDVPTSCDLGLPG